jgi:hypothetical protein
MDIGIPEATYISDRFENVATTNKGLGKIWNSGSSTVVRMFMGLPDTVTTRAEVIAWFSANPTTVIYPLATPTTEQGTPYAENIPCDPDGTLNWTQSAGVPQGNEIFYPADLKGALDSIVAALPSANGTYTLRATVTTAGVTFSWS